jgi:putative transposase
VRSQTEFGNETEESVSRYSRSIWQNSLAELVPKLRLGTHSPKLRFASITHPMTRTRYRIYDDEFPHFMTCTIVGWLALFTRPEAVQLVFDSWEFLNKEKGFRLYGYVVLENHLHLIASAPKLSNAVKSFKMYTARHIIDLLEQHGAKALLKQLQALKHPHKTESDYQVWQEGSKPKQIDGDDMMLQKLEYIHNNPVKRDYVDDPLHWRYSSARNYAGIPGLVPVITDWH